VPSSLWCLRFIHVMLWCLCCIIMSWSWCHGSIAVVLSCRHIGCVLVSSLCPCLHVVACPSCHSCVSVVLSSWCCHCGAGLCQHWWVVVLIHHCHWWVVVMDPREHYHDLNTSCHCCPKIKVFTFPGIIHMESNTIPYGFHCIPCGMEAYPPWIPWNKSQIPWKFCWDSRETTLYYYCQKYINIKNQTLDSAACHMHA